MRCFVAIELSGEVRGACGALIAELRPETPKVRWVPPENIHLTLRFLGDIEDSVGERVMERVAAAAADLSPMTLTARGLGCFPNPRKPSVVWLGVHTAGDGLARLQQAAEEAAREAGLAAEKRAFKPHLTLGRIRQPGRPVPMADLAKQYEEYEAGAWTVRDVALFASELHPAGARYHRVAAVPLGTPE